MKKRIVGYDVIKTMAMFLVVMLHYAYYTKYYSSMLVGTAVTVLCVVCVPLFFMVNGALLLNRPMDEKKHYHKVFHIIVIVIIWKLIAAAFCVFIDGSHSVSPVDLLRFVLGAKEFGDYLTGYFWFMHALVAVYLVLPLVKMAFDAEKKTTLHVFTAVLFFFTVGKDTVRLVLQMVGTATHSELASIVDPLDELYIFGYYGYVLLYVVVGGMLGRYLQQRKKNDRVEDCEDSGVYSLLSKISTRTACIVIFICYISLFLIQRYQHAADGSSLVVENGYWLLPTFIETVLIMLVLGQANITGFWARFFKVTGMNTFGVYMLHMAGLIGLSRLQNLPCFQFMGSLNNIAVTALNVLLCCCVFACCLAASVILRKIPYINRLFAL